MYVVDLPRPGHNLPHIYVHPFHDKILTAILFFFGCIIIHLLPAYSTNQTAKDIKFNSIDQCGKSCSVQNLLGLKPKS